MLLKSKKVCRQWDGDEETKTEIEREKGENKKEEKVVRIGKARMAHSGGGGC